MVFSPFSSLGREPTLCCCVWFRVQLQDTSKNMIEQMTEDPKKSRLKQQIDDNLKRVYDDALNAEVPDRFKALLEELKKREAKQ
jgi:Anti-sigma factor NepR